jgi:DNA-binding NarL/FixJ family response regulator
MTTLFEPDIRRRTAGQTTVVLVEDHAMVATALAGVLDAQSDIELQGVAGTIAEALDIVAARRPDVVIADHRLPDGDSTDAVGALLAAAPSAAVLVVAGLPTEQAFLNAMDAGATGFVSKSQPMDEFIDAVRRVGTGETVVAPSLLPALVRRIHGGVDRRTLTPRELDVLQHLAHGRSTSQVAAVLGLSPNTVRNHVANLSVKLGAHSRLEAVSIGVRRGLIAPTAS